MTTEKTHHEESIKAQINEVLNGVKGSYDVQCSKSNITFNLREMLKMNIEISEELYFILKDNKKILNKKYLKQIELIFSK